jgi:uncharacterized protein (DUF488 family)
MATVFTIGHSTRDLAEFTALLQAHSIEALADIRAFPMSKRYPHFNREALEMWLHEVGVEYIWCKDLGGRRGKQQGDSPNVALRNDSFRNYADYMLTPQFQAAIADLLIMAEKKRTAIMCAEAVYFRCHRMLVSDYLVAHGHNVLHITDLRAPREHTLTKEARMIEGQLLYRGDRLFS